MAADVEQLAEAVTAAARKELADSAEKIRHCLDQLDDEQIWWRPEESMNGIANLILHLCGNLEQWIVSGIGGAPDDRDRPNEFSTRGPTPKAELIRLLDETLARVDNVLAKLTASQLLEKRRIQEFDTTVLGAIFHTVPHFTGHSHQIVYISRLQLRDAYTFHWSPWNAEQGTP